MGGASSLPAASVQASQQSLQDAISPDEPQQYQRLPPPADPDFRRLPPVNPDLTDWVTVQDWHASQDWFRPGDLVEFDRSRNGGFFSSYNHWGMFLGNGLIAHVTTRGISDAATDASTIVATATAASATLGLAAPSIPSAASSSPLAIGGFEVIRTMIAKVILEQSPPIDTLPPHRYYTRLDPIWVVAGQDQFRVNNLLGRASKYVKRSLEEIVSELIQYVNRPFQYDVARSNCEHFATHLRYRRQ